MREIILDIETTGLEFKEGHRIIEIGCIELNKKEVGSNYHQYINPSKTLTEDNIKIHGITNEYLTDKPIFEEIADSFLEFIKDSFIVAHNASFDIGFLNFELEKLSAISSKIGLSVKYSFVIPCILILSSVRVLEGFIYS